MQRKNKVGTLQAFKQAVIIPAVAIRAKTGVQCPFLFLRPILCQSHTIRTHLMRKT